MTGAQPSSNPIATGLSTLGSVFHIPNFGFSQAISGQAAPVQPAFGLPVDPSFSGMMAGQQPNSYQARSNYMAPNNPANNGNISVLGASSTQVPQPSPTTSNNGGGNNNSGGGNNYGGYGSKQAWFNATGNAGQVPVGWNGPSATNQMGSQQDLINQVNDAYGGVNDALNSWQNTLQQGLPAQQAAAAGQFEQLRPDLQQAYQQGMNLNQNQVQSTQQDQANALAQARSLFNEVQKGAGQRFGGSTGTGTGVSSAADFANAYYNSQLGQNEAGINNTAAKNLGALQTQASTVQSQFQNNLKQLEDQKAQAVNQVQAAFQQQLAQVQQTRTMAADEKAQTQLSMLQQLRQNLQNINNQYTQFQQGLQAQYQQANLGLRNAIQTYSVLANNPTALQSNPMLAYSIPGLAGVQSYGMPMVGSVGNHNQQQQQ